MYRLRANLSPIARERAQPDNVHLCTPYSAILRRTAAALLKMGSPKSLTASMNIPCMASLRPTHSRCQEREPGKFLTRRWNSMTPEQASLCLVVGRYYFFFLFFFRLHASISHFQLVESHSMLETGSIISYGFAMLQNAACHVVMYTLFLSLVAVRPKGRLKWIIGLLPGSSGARSCKSHVVTDWGSWLSHPSPSQS